MLAPNQQNLQKLIVKHRPVRRWRRASASKFAPPPVRFELICSLFYYKRYNAKNLRWQEATFTCSTLRLSLQIVFLLEF